MSNKLMSNKSMNKTTLKNNQMGFTLIEMMIAGTLGLLLLLGVMQIYLGATQTNRLQSGVTEVQDKGRFILTLLEKDLQRAGWINIGETSNAINYIDFSSGTTNGDGVIPTGSTVAASDAITIEYQVEDYSGTGTEYNCGGGAVDKDSTIRNSYFVSSAGVLSCTGNNNGTITTQPLIENIDSLQILYGVESITADRDGIADGYVSFANIGTYTNNVITVRIAVLISSSSDVLDVGQSNVNTYRLLDTTYTAPGDRKLRRLFIKTIYLPNHPNS
jgi:type IV pilus assembly protein PilW